MHDNMYVLGTQMNMWRMQGLIRYRVEGVAK